MPQRVQPIYSDNPGPLPAVYNLPPGLDLELSSIRARVDGSGAAADFIVVCETLTSDGRIMTQSRIDQEFAVGDTGALTWAPFLRRSVAAAPPPPGGSTVEWVYYSSTTNWGAAGLTTLTFTQTGGNFDSTTFGLSAGNPQIKRDGFYEAWLLVFNVSVPGGVETLIRAELDRISGPTPGSWIAPSSPLAVSHSFGEWSLSQLQPQPFSKTFYDYPPGTFGATPSTFEVVAWQLDDGLIVATSDPIVRLAFVRLGDSLP